MTTDTLNISLIIILLTITINLLLSLLVWRKSPNRRKGKLFIALITTFNIFILTSHLTDRSISDNLMYIILKIDFSAGLITTYLFMIFSKSFAKSTKLFDTKASYTGLLTTLVLLLVVGSDLIIKNVKSRTHGIAFDSGPLDIIFVTAVLINIAAALKYLKKAHESSSGIKKLQIQYLLLGATIPTVLIIIIGLLMERISSFGISNSFDPYIQTLRSISLSSGIIFTIITSISILKYKLFNIKSIFIEFFVYLFDALISVAFVYSVFFIETSVFENLFSTIAIITNILLATIFIGILRRVSTQFRQLLFSKLSYLPSDPEMILDDFNIQLSKLKSSEHTVELLISTVKSLYSPDKLTLFLATKNTHESIPTWSSIGFSRDEESLLYENERINSILELSTNQDSIVTQQLIDNNPTSDVAKLLSSLNIELIIPIANDEIHGVLLLGKKNEYEAYTNEDLNLLEKLVFYAGLNLSRTV